MPTTWTPQSWRQKPITQVPVYPDAAKLEAAEAQLRQTAIGAIAAFIGVEAHRAVAGLHRPVERKALAGE